MTLMKKKNNSPKSKMQKNRGITIPKPLLLIFILLSFLGLWEIWDGQYLVAQMPSEADTGSQPPTLLPTFTPLPTDIEKSEILADVATLPPEIIVITATPAPYVPTNLQGLIIASISEQGYFHLFAFHPDHLPFSRLTFGEWDDLDPELSPDGRQIIFSSNRNGYWDIFLLDIYSGEVSQITNDNNFNGSPTWSPDGSWIAYEKFKDGNLDIYLEPIDKSLKEPIRATFDSRADKSPSWSADNTKIAFSSNRNGNFDIWVLKIESIGQDGSLSNITNNNTLSHTNPIWSPQNNQLAYVTKNQGYPSVYISNQSEPSQNMKYIGFGTNPTWDQEGRYILVSQPTPDQTLFTAYDVDTKTYVIPPTSVEGRISSFSWGIGTHPIQLADRLIFNSAINLQPSYEVALTPSVGGLYGRQYTIEIPGIKAPNPALSALAIESFLALRDRLINELGWDILSDLEDMFVPINQPLDPYRDNDWLYTGRAFSLNNVLIEMGWMVVVKENFGDQTFWRVYVKPLNQDGSQGKPISNLPWDFNARFTGNTTDYENGGAMQITLPEGYWVDFTALAFEYGWERQPSLSNWRSYYPGIRYSTFTLTSGLKWEDAMLQMWPPEVLKSLP
jgi:TolB protein